MSLISNSLTRVFKNVAVTAAACLALVATGATAADKVYRLKLAETWDQTSLFSVTLPRTWRRWLRKCRMVDCKSESIQRTNTKPL